MCGVGQKVFRWNGGRQDIKEPFCQSGRATRTWSHGHRLFWMTQTTLLCSVLLSTVPLMPQSIEPLVLLEVRLNWSEGWHWQCYCQALGQVFGCWQRSPGTRSQMGTDCRSPPRSRGQYANKIINLPTQRTRGRRFNLVITGVSQSPSETESALRKEVMDDIISRDQDD